MKRKKLKPLKSRVTWGFSPVTRVKKSHKLYSRKSLHRECANALKE